MITGRDIVFISSIDWSHLWQVHQEIALRFAQAGNRVIYIENTGVRSPGLSDAGRILLRLKSWAKSLRSRGLRQVAPNIYVISPLMFPPFSSAAGQLSNKFLFAPFVKRALKRLDVRDPILWTYLPTDTALTLIEKLHEPKSLLIYYCVADFTQLTPHQRELRKVEERIVKQSDLVFTNSSQLAEYCKQWREEVYVFPPGVDFKKFLPEENSGPGSVKAKHGETKTFQTNNSLISSLPRPVIGYVGGLHRFVDYDLVIQMARARPDWSWAFIGPVQTTIDGLGKLSNVFLLGQKSHDELAPLIRDFDICVVPYLVNSSSATIAPVKINEYLAVGKPVVSTELPTVCEFNQQHKILMTAANNSESFLSAIEQALRLPEDMQAIARRREVAALADWQNRFNAMNKLLDEKLQLRTGSISSATQ
jgi:glycosyltransferase involved in cell wall biosynthesis